MSVISDINRESVWFHRKNNYCDLKYTITDNQAIFVDADDSAVENCGKHRLSYFDVSDIDVSNCTFDEFVQVMTFAKESCTAFEYDEAFLESFKDNFNPNEKYNFYEYFENYRLNCAKNGNFKLYYEVQTIAQATHNMFYINKKEHINDITDNGFFVSNVFMNLCCSGRNGSYELGTSYYSINDSVYKFVSEYDYDSTIDKPKIVVSVSDYGNTKENLVAKYVVDVNSIDFNNVSAIELYAYYSYQNSLTNADWQNDYNSVDQFTMLFDSGALIIDNVDDLYTSRYDLKELAFKAQEQMNEIKHGGGIKKKGINFEISFTEEYIEKCRKFYEELILSMVDR